MSITTEKKQYTFNSLKVQPPAFSFFFAIHSGSEKKLHDQGHIKNRCHEALKAANLDSSTLELLTEKVDALITQIDYSNGFKSVGLFLAPDMAFAKPYSVALPERHYMGTTFSNLENLWAQEYSRPYLLFLFDSTDIHAYRGHDNHIETLESNGDLKHLLSIWHHKTGKGLDRDGKGHGPELDATVREDVLATIAKISKDWQAPILLVGGAQIAADVGVLEGRGIKVVYVVADTITKTAPEQLKPYLEEWLKIAKERKLAAVSEEIHAAKLAHKLVTGEEEILALATEGRGEILVLEEPNGKKTFKAEFTTMHKAVEEVLLKQGAVEFVPAKMLEEWHGKALITRY